MVALQISAHLKPLHEALIQVEFPRFILTPTFDCLMAEHDWDPFWDECLSHARRMSGVEVLAPEYTGYARDALGLFIGVVGPSEPQILFNFLQVTLAEFLRSRSSSIDLSPLPPALLRAGYSQDQIDSLLVHLKRIELVVPVVLQEGDRVSSLDRLALGVGTAIESEALEKVIQICGRFYAVAKQLRKRYDNRQTLDVNDEYDVQDLFHSLLGLFFDDIRPEEHPRSSTNLPIHTGFLLKKEEIFVQTKITRRGFTDEAIAEQLRFDIEKYRLHPHCKTLVCFVYDPEGRVKHPKQLKKNWSGNQQGLKVILLISPHS
jgi:hypothetical protein